MGLFSGIEDMLSSGRASKGQNAQYGAELNAAEGITPEIQANTATTTGNYNWAPTAVTNAETGLNSMVNSDYLTGNANQFQLETNPEKYVNPAVGFQEQQVTKTNNASAANNGGLFSTGNNAANEIAQGNIASNAWNSGLTEMNSQNQLGSQNYENILNNSLQRQQLRGNLMQTTLANSMTGLGALTSQENQGTGALINNQMDIGNLTGHQLASQKEAPGIGDYILGGLGGLENEGSAAVNSFMGNTGKTGGLAAVGG